MTPPRPPALLGATVLRLAPELAPLTAAASTPRQVLHPGHPRRSGVSHCYKRRPPNTRPAGFLEARALPLCRACAVELATGARHLDLKPTRADAAAWYAARVQLAEDLPGGAQLADELIGAAIADGVTGLTGVWHEGAQAYPLHELFAPYRRRPGGHADRAEAARRTVLNAAPTHRRRIA